MSTPSDDDTISLESLSFHRLELRSTVQRVPQSTSRTPTPPSSRTTRKNTSPNKNTLEEAYEAIHVSKNKMMSREELGVYGQYRVTKLRALNDENSIIIGKYCNIKILIDARLRKHRLPSNTQGSGPYNKDTVLRPVISVQSLLRNILYVVQIYFATMN